MYIYKIEKTDIPQRNMVLIYVFYQILLIIGESILLGRLKLGDEVLDVSGGDTIFTG